MPRLKITEYAAKKIILDDRYQGISLTSDRSTTLPKNGRFVVKVDQGIKKRFKQGLVALDQTPAKITPLITSWKKRGFDQFLLEPYFDHALNEERYLSLERVREGVRLLFAEAGGINIEEHPEAIQSFIIDETTDLANIVTSTKLPKAFLQNFLAAFEKNFFAFVEINPLVVREDEVHLLDAAVLVDSAGEFFLREAWGKNAIVETKAKHVAEEHVAALAKTTPASLKLTVLHPNGSLFFLLSGGGGSIVIADEAEMQGMGKMIGNYGEYSGGPTREETHLYTREVLDLLLSSSAKKKALVIAGGVANFTDVLTTFDGIIDALTEKAEQLRRAKVNVFVRRGGPNEEAGLARMRTFLEQEHLFGSIHGSDAMITQAVDDAIDYLRP